MAYSPIPDLPSNPRSITQKESIALLLSSLAMNEISLSHLIRAEAEAVRCLVESRTEQINYQNVAMISNTAARILEEASNSQRLGLGKLDRILRLLTEANEIYGDEEALGEEDEDREAVNSLREKDGAMEIESEEEEEPTMEEEEE